VSFVVFNMQGYVIASACLGLECAKLAYGLREAEQ
jgi:hypothetical protein